MFQNFFNPENPIFRFTGRVLDLAVLSILFLACCLPVVTIGPATAALYYSCVKCLRYKEGQPYRSFLTSFRQNLKTGIAATLVFLPAALVLDAGYLFFLMAAQTGQTLWGLLLGAYLLLLLVPIAVATCAFPLLSRFSCTVGSLLQNSLALTLRHLPRLLGAAVVSVGFFFLTAWGWYYGLMMLTPALWALAVSFFLEPPLRACTPTDAAQGDVPWYLR